MIPAFSSMLMRERRSSTRFLVGKRQSSYRSSFPLALRSLNSLCPILMIGLTRASTEGDFLPPALEWSGGAANAPPAIEAAAIVDTSAPITIFFIRLDLLDNDFYLPKFAPIT